MTLFQPTEDVVACDACGFAGLVGERGRDWMAYRMAGSEARWVLFAFCTACGISCVQGAGGGAISRQPAPLRVAAGAVPVAPWESAPAGSDRSGCPACGSADGLLWSVPEPSALNRVVCPACWTGPLRFTDRRASHPGW